MSIKPRRIRKPVSRSVLPRVRVTKRISLPNRATMVNSLLRNRKTAAFLKNLTDQKGISPSRLATMSLDGEAVRGSVLRAGAKVRAPAVSEFDWEAGIQFTPKSPGPTYTHMGKTYNTGSLLFTSFAYWPPGVTLKDLYDQDVLHVTFNQLFRIILQVELPPEPSTYMITALLPGLTQSDAEAIVFGVEDAVGTGEVYHTLLSDGSGIVGIHTTNPYTPPQDTSPELKMRKVSCSIHMLSQIVHTFPQPSTPSLSGPMDFEGAIELITSMFEGAAASANIPPLHTFGGFVITRL